MSIINTALIGKLKKTKADKTNVLELNNTTTYTPTENYHPTTKKYVDEKILTSGGGTTYNVFSQRSTQDFTATDGQTIFTTTLELNDVEVFYNGLKLDNEDYTVNKSYKTITLGEACEENDNIEVIDYGYPDLTGETFVSTSTEPENPSIGVVWQDTSTLPPIIKIWNGTVWVILGNVDNLINTTEYTLGTSSGLYDGSLITFPVSYTVGLIDVFLNGLKLLKSEYIATNGISITLVEPGIIGQSIQIVTYTQVNSNSFYTKTEIDNLLEGQGTGTSNTTGLSEQVIDSFPVSGYRSGEYLITCSTISGFMTLKLLVLHDDVETYNTIYGQLGTDLGTFDTSINGSNVEILFTPNVDGVEVKFNKIMIENTGSYNVVIPGDLMSGSSTIDLNIDNEIIDLNS